MAAKSREWLVVLGAKLNPDGTLGDAAQGRLNYALKLLEENPEAKLLLSGGKPAYMDDPEYKKTLMPTEAQAMRQHVPEEFNRKGQVLSEIQSLDFIGNAVFLAEKISKGWAALQQPGVIRFITSANYVERMQAIAEHVFPKGRGIETIVEAYPESRVTPREQEIERLKIAKMRGRGGFMHETRPGALGQHLDYLHTQHPLYAESKPIRRFGPYATR